MINEALEQVMSVLEHVGLFPVRAYPARAVPALDVLQAVVSVKSADTQAVQVQVLICCPAALGGSACEDAAALAAHRLGAEVAQCQIEACRFDGDSGLFTATVLVTLPATLPQVQINGVAVERLTALSTSFSCTPAQQEEGTAMVGRKKRWSIRLEDIFEGADTTPEDGFTLHISLGNVIRCYSGCCWSGDSTEATAYGLRRVRTAVTCNAPQEIQN